MTSQYFCTKCSNRIWAREKGLVMVLCQACQEKMVAVKKEVVKND